MSIWPFRRKSKRKNAGTFLGAKRAATDPITAMQRSGSHRSVGSQRRQNGSQTELSGGLARKRTGRLKNRQQSGSKLVKDPERRAYSFSPGRKESIGIPKDVHHQYPVPPIPDNAATMPGKTGTINPRTGARIYQTTTNDSIERAPTLHKRSAVDLNHRKSSKKRKEDSERLSELKAMTKSMPPPSRSSTTPDPFRTDTVKVRGIKRIFTNHASNMSLPQHQSVHSSNSSDQEAHTSYILKGIDMFSPRPTIRYADPSTLKFKSTPTVDRATTANSRADEFDKEKSRKRIEELADELDAHDLHELMDRDRRRRERKKQHDAEKMERKLARRKAKQDAALKEAAKNGDEPPKNLERGVIGRELEALNNAAEKEERPPLVPRKSSRRRSSRRNSAASSRYSRELAEKLQELQDDERATQRPTRSPTDEFVRSASLPITEPASPADEPEEPVIQTAQVARLSRANLSPPASPRHVTDHKREVSNVSQMPDLPPAPILSNPSPLPTPPLPFPKREGTPANDDQKSDAYRRSSETGSSFQHSSWKSWFKRASKDRRSSTQSSFSNTTRESIIASQAQSQTQPTPPVAFATPVGQASGFPKRTMSRFREDLPEMPMSPPSSRVQSPEAIPIPGARGLDPHRAHLGYELSDPPSGLRRFDSPNSFGRPMEQGSSLRYETPTTERDMPSPEPVNVMSQSLASIDSEGSWLSGRPRADSKRSSVQRSSARSSRQQGDYNQNLSRLSHSSLQARRYKDFSDHLDDGGDIAEDEYYSRLSPDMYNQNHARDNSRVSGNPMPSSDEEDNGQKMRTPISAGAAGNEGTWGDISRKPTIIRHVQRTQSAQGVLDNYDDGSSDDDGDEKRESEYGLMDGFENRGPDYRPRTPESPREYDNSEFEASPSGDKLQRATSIDFKKNHIRHISAGSARLLDLKPRMSGEGKRKSVGF